MASDIPTSRLYRRQLPDVSRVLTEHRISEHQFGLQVITSWHDRDQQPAPGNLLLEQLRDIVSLFFQNELRYPETNASDG